MAEAVPAAARSPARAAPSYPKEVAARRADALAVSLRAAADAITSPLARAATALVEREAWAWLGFARLDDLARERYGRSGRWLRDLAALGRMFSTMPGLEAAVCGSDGGPAIGRVAGLLVGRVATAETLALWIDRARRTSVRELREEVAAARAKACDRREGASGLEEPGSIAAGAGPTDDDGTAGGANEDRSLVRIGAPSEVAAAFDEALDLFRAVEGREATVTSFIEALVAEAVASGVPVDPERGAFSERLRRGATVAARERALARATEGWSSLPPPRRGSEWALRLAGASLLELRRLQDEAGRGGPDRLDAQMRALLALEDQIERRLAGLLVQMASDGAWTRLMFDSAEHYAEQRLGMGRTATRLRLRVARALRGRPGLKRAYEEGAVGAEAAWMVSRMMGGPTSDGDLEADWVDRARRATVKRLRDELRIHRRGRAGLERAHAGSRPLTDAAWHAGLHRQAGTARARLREMGGRVGGLRVSDVFLTFRLPAELAEDLLAAVASARAGVEGVAAAIPWEKPWPDPDPPGSLRAAREHVVRCRRVPDWIGLLALLEEFVETWDTEAGPRKKAQALYERDGWRCAAPGCSSRRNLEEHHVHYRSRGGSNMKANRVTLCRFHHQLGEHGGLARCRGRAPLGLLWSLGRNGASGRFRNELRVAG